MLSVKAPCFVVMSAKLLPLKPHCLWINFVIYFVQKDDSEFCPTTFTLEAH